jgi:hypothetical protein
MCREIGPLAGAGLWWSGPARREHPHGSGLVKLFAGDVDFLAEDVRAHSNRTLRGAAPRTG